MHRYFVTGTDTDVGKTRVTAALARARRDAGERPTVVKLVQTGAPRGATGDAERAGRLAGVSFFECARFLKPADPWSAALAEGAAPLRAAQLAAQLDQFRGPLVAEGAGGLMVPLNADEDLGHVAVAAGLRAVVAVGLRLGCMNHALLTLERCARVGLAVAGGVLVERWGTTPADYREDVLRVLQGKLEIFGILGFAPEELGAVEPGARLFDALVK